MHPRRRQLVALAFPAIVIGMVLVPGWIVWAGLDSWRSRRVTLLDAATALLFAGAVGFTLFGGFPWS